MALDRLRRAAMPLALVLAVGAILGPTALTQSPAADEPVCEDTIHWSFIPPRRPPVPAVDDRVWVRNPIDAFIRSSLESFDLAPAPEADRATLLRRLSFDLTGLPPTPEELEAFERDTRADAYERQVDRLLGSPTFGERQAQHWLDLARYADTDGYEFDAVRPGMWRYRDWVVDAINRDLPYDEFIRLQTAGDELRPGDPNAAIATGFHRCYPDMPDMNDQAERRQIALNDITETTGLVFLGLTIGCARCHDHKTDPILQSEFYELQAFFAGATLKNPDTQPGVKPAAGPLPDAPARVLAERSPAPEPTYLLIRGQHGARGPQVAPAVPQALARKRDARRLSITPSSNSAGRRTALAEWLTRPDHPLTARVVVNRIWQRHFGRGLVPTPSDFGATGIPPTQPDLLDWLATELVARGWSLKAMHRLIVTSAAYRMSSVAPPESVAADPENELLGRQSRRRLDGEAMRDALLAVAGQLDHRVGGPGVFPPLPDEIATLPGSSRVWPVSTRLEDQNRRSLYVFVRRNLRFPFFEAFDRPDANVSCPQRPATTIAPQALSLLNGRLATESARALAQRVALENGASIESRVTHAYRLTLGRTPSDQELTLAREFLATGDPEQAWTGFALALLNLNEFAFLD